jgi:CRP-like cAMP-binding protein
LQPALPSKAEGWLHLILISVFVDRLRRLDWEMTMGRQHLSAAPPGRLRLAPLAEANRNIRIAGDSQRISPEEWPTYEEPVAGAFGLKLERYGRHSGQTPHSIRSLMTHKRVFEPGVPLIQQGDAGGAAYIIEDGWTFSSRVLRNGSRQILDVQIPGDVAALQSLPAVISAHDVTAITQVHATEIRLDSVMGAVSSDAELAAFIFWLSAEQNHVASERLIDIGRRTSVERMGHFILELATRLRLAGIGTETGFPCPMTQNLLGDALGLTSVHVNRVLRDLRTSGLAHQHRGWISLLNTGALKDLSGFNGAYLFGTEADSAASM